MINRLCFDQLATRSLRCRSTVALTDSSQNLMNYLLLLILVLPQFSKAQSNVTGVGHFIIGLTTPDSLNPAEFNEQEQAYVKGTIALPCSHIRSFTSTKTTIAGSSVTNVVLVFYDNRLFKLACDYNQPLRATFTQQYGSGVVKPTSHFQLCPAAKDKPLSLWGEAWPSGDIAVLVVYRNGYTAECRWETGARLTIWSQQRSALCSECDLHPDALLEAYLQAQPGK